MSTRVLNLTVECDGGYDYSSGEAVERDGTVILCLSGFILAEWTVDALTAEMLRGDDFELERFVAARVAELFKSREANA